MQSLGENTEMFGDYDDSCKGPGLVQATLCKTIHGSTRLIHKQRVCPVGHTLTRTGCAAALAHINRGTTPNPNIDNYFDPIHPLRVKGVPLL